jgi:hypothetical protein
MKRISCCKKFCHDDCLNKWIKVLTCKNKFNLTCPYCRTILKQQSKISTPLQQIKLYSYCEKNETDSENSESENDENKNEDEIVYKIDEDSSSDCDDDY